MLAGVWPWAPLVVAATTTTPATLTSLNPQAMAAAIFALGTKRAAAAFCGCRAATPGAGMKRAPC